MLVGSDMSSEYCGSKLINVKLSGSSTRWHEATIWHGSSGEVSAFSLGAWSVDNVFTRCVKDGQSGHEALLLWIRHGAHQSADGDSRSAPLGSIICQVAALVLDTLFYQCCSHKDISTTSRVQSCLLANDGTSFLKDNTNLQPWLSFSSCIFDDSCHLVPLFNLLIFEKPFPCLNQDECQSVQINNIWEISKHFFVCEFLFQKSTIHVIFFLMYPEQKNEQLSYASNVKISFESFYPGAISVTPFCLSRVC